MICPYCKKDNSVRHGTRKNKCGWVKINLCKSCNRHFSKRDGFENMRTKPEIIISALDLRAKGMSLGKIVLHLEDNYNCKVSRSTILYWQYKFGEMIENFTKQFSLPQSENSHADEMFLRIKPAKKDEFIYYWDCIDYDTKFIVGEFLSIARTDEFAIEFMENIKSNIDDPPENMHTDNSWDYPPAIKKVFKKKTNHIHFPAWKKKFKNNPIERYHNTVRENYKTMRRLGNFNSAKKYLTFFKNYYNFLRRHTSLNWHTPSEIAGFGKWNWWTLIKSQIFFLVKANYN